MRQFSLFVVIISLVVGLLVGGLIGYFAGGGQIGGTQQNFLKAAWIYVGPIGDYGWSHAHDVGRKIVDNMFPWLETVGIEKIDPGKLRSQIDDLIARGYKLIFTTSFDFMQGTYDAAEAYPNVIFFHCSGYMRRANMGTYFAELYQLYYLNGLMAGALTKTGKLGYVAAHLIPEVVRHINAFMLGALDAAHYLNKSLELYVMELGSWYNPEGARNLADVLVNQYNVDAIAYTEDSPAIIQYAEELYEEHGKLVYVFSHYSPMYSYGPNVTVSGQLVHWEKIYEDIVTKVYSGAYNSTNLENVDYWWMLSEGAVELGADFGMPINPKFEDDLKAIKFIVDDKLKAELKSEGMEDVIQDGKISVYDLIMLRLKQMSEVNPTFEPFTGPIYDNNGDLRVPEGVRLGHDDLWNIDWFVMNITKVSAS